MSRLPRVPSLALVLALSGALVGIGGPSRSQSSIPTVRLVGAVRAVELSRYPGSPVSLELGTYLASVGGPFELRARKRPNGSFELVQVVPDGDGVRVVRTLPSDLVRSFDQGLRRFFLITARRGEEVVARTSAPFCPDGYDSSRMSESGPDTSRYPFGCHGSEVTRAAVWGIEHGWSVAAPLGWTTSLDLPKGTFDITVAIRPEIRKLLGVAPSQAAVTVRAVVTEEDFPAPWPETAARQQADGPHAMRDRVVPQVEPDASGIPDLEALPAWQVGPRHEDGRDVVDFAATVWNAGPGPLVVEGFRRPGAEVMNAYQYFYDKGVKVGRAEVGTLEYDPRDGHHHWHFTDFARYRLLDRSDNEVVRSQKEAFCLAPTDAVDLTVPGANWTPGSTGLWTACGWRNSIWIREILDAGWGDTYMQSLPGQSFDITDVPNGSYLIEVTTNPDGRLTERRTDNNRAVLPITLGGKAGNRTVTLAR